MEIPGLLQVHQVKIIKIELVFVNKKLISYWQEFAMSIIVKSFEKNFANSSIPML